MMSAKTTMPRMSGANATGGDDDPADVQRYRGRDQQDAQGDKEGDGLLATGHTVIVLGLCARRSQYLANLRPRLLRQLHRSSPTARSLRGEQAERSWQP